MIPYFTAPPIPVGPILVQPWGSITALAVFVAYWLFVWRARKLALGDPKLVKRYALALGVGAFVSWKFSSGLAPWGFASVLAPLGGFAVATAYAYVKKLDPLRMADAASTVFPVGWFISRLACALVHDHLGIVSSSWIAVEFPAGPRLDMGLIECLLTPILLVAVWVGARVQRPGSITGTVAATYALMRFPLDFLRTSDPTVLGLTAVQWGCIPLLLYGMALVINAHSPRPFGFGTR